VRALAERAYFAVCLMLGRMLRGTTYSKASLVSQNGETLVRKRRRFYAPLLVAMGDSLVRMLDTGVRVLSQRDWEKREQQMYSTLYDASIRTDGRTLILPCLAGETLATLLENPSLDDQVRTRAIELAFGALAEFHVLGFTHGDAMAENVMVDLEHHAARWFDFETVHDSQRTNAWRRADDVRALVATCLLRTAPETYARDLHLIVNKYADQEVTRLLATNFASALRRPLIFHLGQAGLSFRSFRRIGSLLRASP
jgi:hypothetical protein